ncbi:unnamed protein product [Gongylonema pulchrum]|uniref:L-seryl-tRNA(Sec) kinase n=1 Tax=Gongylonema pulchrum TaxID=637853 RepID=A0A183CV47_9BILA|nr:unnamed protein product [Gongylonema pulchrum]
MALVLVMGIPGAGKTTLCKNLEERIGTSCCAIFSFDDIFNDDGFMEHLWGKEYAHAGILHLYGLDSTPSAHSERKRCETRVRDFLRNQACRGESSRVTVVDDIFYLRSMRRPFKRMANTFHLAYMVVLVDVPLDLALAQNAQRPEQYRIPEQVIAKINKNMELPAENEPSFIYRPGDSLDELAAQIRKQRETALSRPVRETQSTVQPAADEKWKKLELDLRRCIGELVRETGARTKGALLSEIKKAVYLDLRTKDIPNWDIDGLKDILRQRILDH